MCGRHQQRVGAVFRGERGSVRHLGDYWNCSMRTGCPNPRPYGDAFRCDVAESFWSSLKRELVTATCSPTEPAGSLRVDHSPGSRRLHSSLGHIPPIESRNQLPSTHGRGGLPQTFVSRPAGNLRRHNGRQHRMLDSCDENSVGRMLQKRRCAVLAHEQIPPSPTPSRRAPRGGPAFCPLSQTRPPHHEPASSGVWPSQPIPPRGMALRSFRDRRQDDTRRRPDSLAGRWRWPPTVQHERVRRTGGIGLSWRRCEHRVFSDLVEATLTVTTNLGTRAVEPTTGGAW